MEAYVAFGPRQAREKPPDAPGAYAHLVLAAGARRIVMVSALLQSADVQAATRSVANALQS